MSYPKITRAPEVQRIFDRIESNIRAGIAAARIDRGMLVSRVGDRLGPADSADAVFGVAWDNFNEGDVVYWSITLRALVREAEG